MCIVDRAVHACTDRAVSLQEGTLGTLLENKEALQWVGTDGQALSGGREGRSFCHLQAGPCLQADWHPALHGSPWMSPWSAWLPGLCL